MGMGQEVGEGGESTNNFLLIFQLALTSYYRFFEAARFPED